MVENCCFFNNDFIGFGVVRANGGSEITLAGNAGSSTDDDLLCQFVAKSDALNPLEDNEVTCIDFELAVCPYSDETDTRTIKPTSTPAPTPSPTQRSESSAASNASSAATRRIGAALVSMGVAVSFFGLF